MLKTFYVAGSSSVPLLDLVTDQVFTPDCSRWAWTLSGEGKLELSGGPTGPTVRGSSSVPLLDLVTDQVSPTLSTLWHSDTSQVDSASFASLVCQKIGEPTTNSDKTHETFVSSCISVFNYIFFILLGLITTVFYDLFFMMMHFIWWYMIRILSFTWFVTCGSRIAFCLAINLSKDNCFTSVMTTLVPLFPFPQISVNTSPWVTVTLPALSRGGTGMGCGFSVNFDLEELDMEGN